MSNIRSLARRAMVVSLSLSSLLLFSPMAVQADSDKQNWPMYGHKAVSCKGAKSKSKIDGNVTVVPVQGGVWMTVRLYNADPNNTYTIGVAEEPDCKNMALHWYVVKTDALGQAVYNFFYPTSAGKKNLIVWATTQNTAEEPLADANKREIGTKDLKVQVPAAN